MDEHMTPDIGGLARVFRMIRSSLDYFARKYDLTLTEMGIVFDIFFQGEMTLKELSESQGIPKSTVSRLVDGLVKRHVLNREIPEENRRIVRITITEEFRGRMDALRDDAGFQQLLQRDLPGETARLAIRKLGELLELLQSADQPPET